MAMYSMVLALSMSRRLWQAGQTPSTSLWVSRPQEGQSQPLALSQSSSKALWSSTAGIRSDNSRKCVKIHLESQNEVKLNALDSPQAPTW